MACGSLGLVGVVAELGEADGLAGFIRSETERAGKRRATCEIGGIHAAGRPVDEYRRSQVAGAGDGVLQHAARSVGAFAHTGGGGTDADADVVRNDAAAGRGGGDVGIAVGTRKGDREAFGGYTNNILAMRLPIEAVRKTEITSDITSHIAQGANYIQVHPTFLYESIWNILLFFCL